jgi:SAM-dependent methyltransferase
MTTQTLSIPDITAGLTQNQHGFWISPHTSSTPYPEDGHDLFASLEDQSYWFQHRAQLISRLIRDFAPTSTLVDVGAGNGYMAVALTRQGTPCIALEPGQKGAHHAKQRGVTQIINTTLQDAGFRPDSVPAWGLFDVLEHIDNHVSFLQSLYRALQPGGHLFLTVPAFHWLWSTADDYAQHARRYDKASLTHTLQTQGFRVLFCQYAFAPLLPAVALLRALPYQLGQRQHPTHQQLQAEFLGPKGWIGKGLKRSLQLEAHWLAKRYPVPFGTSCVAVAHKPRNAT